MNKEKTEHIRFRQTNFESELEKNGSFIYTNVGHSMMPMLRPNRDLSIISKRLSVRYRKYDVVLYRRENHYVLHRILKVRKKDYIICGDHNWRREYGITDEEIIGVLVSFVRDGKKIACSNKRYMVYVHLWCDFSRFALCSYFQSGAGKK